MGTHVLGRAVDDAVAGGAEHGRRSPLAPRGRHRGSPSPRRARTARSPRRSARCRRSRCTARRGHGRLPSRRARRDPCRSGTLVRDSAPASYASTHQVTDGIAGGRSRRTTREVRTARWHAEPHRVRVSVPTGARKAQASRPQSVRTRATPATRDRSRCCSWAATSSAGLRSKKPTGEQQEARVLHRHDRPVLGPDEVRHAERVPEHDVGVGDRAVGGGPPRQTVTALVLVRVVARGAALARVVRRHPEVVAREAGPACRRSSRAPRASSASTSSARACSRSADRAGSGSRRSRSSTHGSSPRRPPAARRAPSRGASNAGGTRSPTGSPGPAATRSASISYTELVVPSTSRSSARREQVLMVRAGETGRDQPRVLGHLAGCDRHRRDDPGELHLELDVPVEVQVPVEAVLVVADRRDEADRRGAASGGSHSSHRAGPGASTGSRSPLRACRSRARRCTDRRPRSRAPRRSSG